jgi:predicted HAD superfamily phosphohydrolase
MLSHLEDEDIDENRLFKTADQLRSRISNAQVASMLTAAEQTGGAFQQQMPARD